MMFVTKKRPTAVDEVLNYIVTRIKSGDLVRGDKLPSETELCASTGISRGPVREAMKILKYSGILEIRQGDGTYVKEDPRVSLFNPLLMEMMLRRDEKRHLKELRDLMEKGMVPLLPCPPAPDQTARLQRKLEEMEAARNRSPQERAEADRAFHSALGGITGNPLMSRIYDFVLELMISSITKTYETPPARDPLSYHRAIADALARGDRKALARAMEISLTAWEELS